MRSFVDFEGNRWDVVLGRASWGALYALFVPLGRAATVRQVLLRCADYMDAQQLLDECDARALQELFDRSQPKEE